MEWKNVVSLQKRNQRDKNTTEMNRMDEKYDPMGRAIADYLKNGVAGRLRVFSPMMEEDEIPLETLFRDFEEMPELERRALDMARGRVLDVGAGSGCHALVVQERGLDVTAIDISPLAVQTMRKRGVENVLEQDFFALEGERFDTVLMLMNGLGIVGTLARMREFFCVLDRILAPGGQVLCDSSDIIYLFEEEDGSVDLPDSAYYGEMSFQMKYKNILGKPFPWLYVDADTLGRVAEENGYAVEVVVKGAHYDYLARITKKVPV